MGKLRVAITGATGLLGRNLLFEIIKQNITNIENIELLILGRDAKNSSLRDRIYHILQDDGLFYIDPTPSQEEQLLNEFDQYIRCFTIDLTAKNLNLSQEGFSCLSKKPIDIFYHLGASTDLRIGLSVEKEIRETNFGGTIHLVDLVSHLSVGQFCYVGTAYSCGEMTGDIYPDLTRFQNSFRNPYEKAKMEAELFLRRFAKRKKIRCRYFRPSVICGRLIEEPLGAVCKFDVLYGWAEFFLKMKMKKLNKNNDLYLKKVSINIRICVNKKSGLNIIPADYAAKMIYRIAMSSDSGESYHIVHDKETPHLFYIPEILKAINVDGVEYVDNVPEKMNAEECFYYKTAGKIFTPYINTEPVNFNRDSVKKIPDLKNLECPPIDEKNLGVLFCYAKKYNFGMK